MMKHGYNDSPIGRSVEWFALAIWRQNASLAINKPLGKSARHILRSRRHSGCSLQVTALTYGLFGIRQQPLLHNHRCARPGQQDEWRTALSYMQCRPERWARGDPDDTIHDLPPYRVRWRTRHELQRRPIHTNVSAFSVICGVGNHMS